jgi:hypothetical protein
MKGSGCILLVKEEGIMIYWLAMIIANLAPFV